MQSNFFPKQFHYLWIDQMLERSHIKNILSQTLKHSYSALLLATRRKVLFKIFSCSVFAPFFLQTKQKCAYF